jgi:hypothetical protein
MDRHLAGRDRLGFLNSLLLVGNLMLTKTLDDVVRLHQQHQVTAFVAFRIGGYSQRQLLVNIDRSNPTKV